MQGYILYAIPSMSTDIITATSLAGVEAITCYSEWVMGRFPPCFSQCHERRLYIRCNTNRVSRYHNSNLTRWGGSYNMLIRMGYGTIPLFSHCHECRVIYYAIPSISVDIITATSLAGVDAITCYSNGSTCTTQGRTFT